MYAVFVRDTTGIPLGFGVGSVVGILVVYEVVGAEVVGTVMQLGIVYG